MNNLPIWLNVSVPVTETEAMQLLGEPCPTHEDGCSVCDGWKSFHEKGMITLLLEREEFIKKECEPVLFI
jgi:hypothetical protein